MTEEEWGLLKGLGGTVLTAAGKSYISTLLENHRRQKITLIRDFQYAFDDARELISKTEIARVTIIQAKKRPIHTRHLPMKNLQKYTLYALCQVWRDGHTSDARNYDGIPPDAQYLELVDFVRKNPTDAYIMDEKAIAEKTLLGGIYRSMAIKYSKIFLIRESFNSVFFISYASDIALGGRDSDERIRVNIGKFKTALKTF